MHSYVQLIVACTYIDTSLCCSTNRLQRWLVPNQRSKCCWIPLQSPPSRSFIVSLTQRPLWVCACTIVYNYVLPFKNCLL